MAKRQLNVLIPEETRQQIAAIRVRFGLQSDAQAVIYAVNELALVADLLKPRSENPQRNSDIPHHYEEKVDVWDRTGEMPVEWPKSFPLHGQPGIIVKSPNTFPPVGVVASPAITGIYPSIPGAPEDVYICETTNKQHTNNAQYCPRCAPAKELEQIEDAQ